jgi:hypothetical protein
MRRSSGRYASLLLFINCSSLRHTDRRATQQMAGKSDVVARAPIFVISYSVDGFGDELLSARWAISSATSGGYGRSEHP